ncbi:hypothetical protein ACNKF0_09525 [Nocardioides sp. T5]|uniref:hypothetical protein n=1 Tax=Nocardioides sp. T5 TaxID=3400182 RepID=UPI003A885879
MTGGVFPVVDLELSPMARQTGVAYLHDVFLDAGEELAVSDRLTVRDEGGTLWDGEVVAVEKVRLGRKYRLHIHRAAAP